MYVVFFFNDTATTEIYTLSLHDALPIYLAAGAAPAQALGAVPRLRHDHAGAEPDPHAGGPPRADDAGGLRLQVRLRPRRPALAPPRPAGAPFRRRLLGLRGGDQPAPHLPGPARRLRTQPDRH